MGLNTLKGVSASLLFLLVVGCEDTRVGHEHEVANVTVVVPLIERIELDDHRWQTLVTMYGTLESDVNVEHIRIEWQSDMFWVVGDTTGYFRLNCRTCVDGFWYDNTGVIEPMVYNFHSMSPVTNQVSLTDSEGTFGNVLAPVRSMVDRSMMLWWSIGGTVVDSMSIFLME